MRPYIPCNTTLLGGGFQINSIYMQVILAWLIGFLKRLAATFKPFFSLYLTRATITRSKQRGSSLPNSPTIPPCCLWFWPSFGFFAHNYSIESWLPLPVPPFTWCVSWSRAAAPPLSRRPLGTRAGRTPSPTTRRPPGCTPPPPKSLGVWPGRARWEIHQMDPRRGKDNFLWIEMMELMIFHVN